MREGILYRSMAGFKEDWKAFMSIRKALRLTNAQTFALLIAAYRKAEEANK